jgi:hypothetical protein
MLLSTASRNSFTGIPLFAPDYLGTRDTTDMLFVPGALESALPGSVLQVAA